MSRSRITRWLVAAIAVVFFATPIALRAVGVKAKAIENSVFAPAPTLSEGWNFFDEFTRFLIDRMPLRQQAVRANTWISLNVFHTTPQYGLNGLGGVANDTALPFVGRPAQDRAGIGKVATPATGSTAPPPPPATASQVVTGTHGWLYLQGVFDRACYPVVAFAQAAKGWDELLAVIRASGRRAELLVAPDKSTIYPEYVAPSTPNLACSNTGTAALWAQIESPTAVSSGIIGLRKPLLAAKRTAHALLYFRTDSHWNTVGALTMIEEALPSLSRTVRVQPSEIIDSGNIRYGGDLLALLGESGSELAPTRRIARMPGAPVVQVPTALIGDSYAELAFPEIQPYFASIRLLYWATDTSAQLIKGIVESHDVILETIEREFDYRASDTGYASPTFIAQVRRALAAHPLR